MILLRTSGRDETHYSSELLHTQPVYHIGVRNPGQGLSEASEYCLGWLGVCTGTEAPNKMSLVSDLLNEAIAE